MPEKKHIQIFSEVQTSRFKYIANFLFGDILQYAVDIVYHENDLKDDVFTICYSHRAVVEKSIHIQPAALLKERIIEKQEMTFFKWKELPVFFGTGGRDIPFDLFSAAFYLVTRYEEYLPHGKDKHGRFKPEDSIAFRESFLNLPLIDMWMQEVTNVLRKKGGAPPIRKFRYLNTIDVDNAYAFMEKGLLRSTGAILRSVIQLNFSDLTDRLKTLIGQRSDPFNTFDFVLKQAEKYGFKSVFFFLLANYGVNDKNVPHTSRKFRSLIKSVNDYCKVGIHPSYASTDEPELLQMEANRLKEIIHMPVTHSRQHFLKIDIPRSYRELLEVEVYNDYSMGYASELGFRASTCTPFLFFDLEQNRQTRLRVYPYSLMEATLKYYMGKNPEDAMQYFKPIIDRVKNVNGLLCTLWHNDSLSDYGEWEGWRKVYEDMLEYIYQD